MSDEGDIEGIAAWVEDHVGGRAVRIERQPRWRPVWFVTVERDGAPLELCVRGVRVDIPGVFTLEYEMIVQQLLAERGIPVPQVYGWCDEPASYVMDRVPGVADFEATDDDERDAVVADYLRILAEIHALDPAPFEAAGVLRAPTRAGAATVGMRAFEATYRATKRRPDPFLEFCLAWLARNPLADPGRESVVVWDSGQFHHEGGRITGVLDLELAHIGDPLMDLAAFRQRDTVIGYGEPATLYARYAELSGTDVDLDAIRHHHFAFTLSNQMAFHGALAAPPPGSDYMTNLQWCCETNLFAVEALADILELALAPVEIPAATSSPFAVGHRHLEETLRDVVAVDEFEQYRVRGAFRLARHLHRADEIGAEFVQADLDDLTDVLGTRPGDSESGDRALEQFVLADEGRHDVELVHLFHRRLRRAQALLGPSGSAMTTHHVIQPLPDRR